MKYWTLQFREVFQSEFMHGKDNQKRMGIGHQVGLIKGKGLVVGLSYANAKRDHWTVIDLYDKSPRVDYNIDLQDMNIFENERFDFIICNAILEHVKNPFKCAEEMYRVLKIGGSIYVEVPFIQPYHPYKGYDEVRDGILPDMNKNFNRDENHGGDYWRFTPQGICELFNKFEMLDVLLGDQGGIVYRGIKLK